MDELTAQLDNLVVGKKQDKRIIHTFSQLDTELSISDYNMSGYFHKVCDVVVDDDQHLNGKKKRKTEIKFSFCIDNEEWKNHTEWIYIFTCDDKIMKIGGTRTGLAGRCASYLCGRPEFRKNGTCSTTNYILYASILNLLKDNRKVEMYAKKLNKYKIRVCEFEIDLEMDVQVFHAFETKMLEKYKEQSGKYPILSSNSDKRFT